MTDASVWDLLIGHREAAETLREACAAQRVTSAWLFTGPAGVGKRHAALVFAAALTCPEGGDGTCDVCRRVLRGVHPDVHIVEAEGDNVLVEDVRWVRQEAWRSHTESAVTVFILDDADRMTDNAANALLKVLEEPPDGVVLVLIARSADALLPTILSRTRPVAFAALPEGLVANGLVAELGVSEDEAAWATAASHGRVARARSLLTDPGARSRRIDALDLVDLVVAGTSGAALEAAARAVAIADAVAAALKAEQGLELARLNEIYGTGRGTGTMRRSLEASHRRVLRRARFDALREVVADLLGLFRDVLALHPGADPDARPSLVHADRAKQTSALSARVNLTGALRASAALEEADRRLFVGAAPVLTFEQAFLAIQDVAAGRPAGIGRTVILQGGRT